MGAGGDKSSQELLYVFNGWPLSPSPEVRSTKQSKVLSRRKWGQDIFLLVELVFEKIGIGILKVKFSNCSRDSFLSS